MSERTRHEWYLSKHGHLCRHCGVRATSENIEKVDKQRCIWTEPSEDSRGTVFQKINLERDYQEQKWGDNPHTVGEWLLIMQAKLDEAKQAWVKNPGDNDALEELLQVVSVGVACLEQHGVVEHRHSQDS